MSVASSISNRDGYRCGVLVMGITGAGKSRLINMLAGNGVVREGNSSMPCTQRCLAVPIRLDGTEFSLIDTPSFDDPARSGLDIVSDIADILVAQERLGISFRGVIYVHPVTDGLTVHVIQTLNIIKHILGVQHEAGSDGGKFSIRPVFSQWHRVTQTEGQERVEEVINNLNKTTEGHYFSSNENQRFLGNRASAAVIARGIPSMVHTMLHYKRSLVYETIYSGLPIARTSAGTYIDSLKTVSTTGILRRPSKSILGLVPPVRVEEAARSPRFATKEEEELQATAELFIRVVCEPQWVPYLDSYAYVPPR